MTEVRSAETFDVIVIGAGAVGENVADRVVKGGLSALLIEAELVGGECSYWACMPSKALIRPATALKAAQSLAGSREAVTGTIDAEAVLKRRNYFTADWQDDGQVRWVDGAGIKLMRGKAWLTGKLSVEVSAPDSGTHLAQARYAVVLATGSNPTLPPLPGLKDIEFWGTREATSSQHVPKSLVVIGGGVAGTELAQAYRRLGSEVTQLVRGELLNIAPAEARELVRTAFREDGIDLREHTSPRSVSRDSAGVHVDLGGEILHAEELLVATGRAPALADVGLETLDLPAYDAEKPHISTDVSGRVTGTDWLYAVGDAAGKVLLTHQGKYEARITGDAIAARAKAVGAKADIESSPWSKYTQTADELAVPSVIFTDPEIAIVGRSVQQAEHDGVRVTEVSLPIAVAGSSLYADDYRGWAQLVIDADREMIIGATFAGPDVAELLHAATIAIVGEVPLGRLWHAVPSYPTISEVWLRLLEKLGL